MSHVFYRVHGERLPNAVRGEGAYLYDAEGREYLDASGGAAVSILGHGHPGVIAALRAQMDRLQFAHTAFFTSEPAERLAERLVAAAPPGIEQAYFLSGGSEATEAALKLARQFHLAGGEPARSLFIHRRQSYHGNTLGALAVSGNPKRRAPYEPLLVPSPAIAPCYAYRHRREHESEADYGRRAADELEAAIQAAGPGRVAAFIAEPVVGATLGAVPAVDGYFARIQAICRRHGVLMIADEVMCGMGRCGAMYASTLFGLEPDIVTVAKGLGGGYQPIGAMLVSGRVHAQAVRGGGFTHGHTYSGHPMACAAALAVQEALVDDGLLEAVAPLGRSLQALLVAELGGQLHVGDIRGRGLLIGIEFVRDRASKEPFPPSAGLAARLKQQALERGLVCYPGSGTADGESGDHLLLAPPCIISPDEVGLIVERVRGAIDDVFHP